MRGIVLFFVSLLLGGCACGPIPKAGPIPTAGPVQEKAEKPQRIPSKSAKPAIPAKPVKMEFPAYNQSAFIIDYSGYSVSYDESSRLPIWVAYELTSAETDGPINRGGRNFRPDEKIKKVQADQFDYRGSGWSRGHMAPAGDFKWDETAMSDTFFYTNCCPQDETLNNGSWQTLEKKVRSIARLYDNVYVVTGPIIGENQYGKIGSHSVVVPDAFYKALLISQDGKYHAIGFVMKNISQTQPLHDCYLSINELENVSGIDFFPSLDDAIEESVESDVDLDVWRIR